MWLQESTVHYQPAHNLAVARGAKCCLSGIDEGKDRKCDERAPLWAPLGSSRKPALDGSGRLASRRVSLLFPSLTWPAFWPFHCVKSIKRGGKEKKCKRNPFISNIHNESITFSIRDILTIFLDHFPVATKSPQFLLYNLSYLLRS